jgi:hypothetical protein
MNLTDKPMIDLISEITEFNDMKEFMGDPDLDYALDLIIKLIAKPDVPSSKAPDLIIKMQALSAKFAMLSRFYTTFEKGGENAKKKNVYYTAEEAINRLVDALKYSARYGA